jgi:AraC-like DNA-binding protein
MKAVLHLRARTRPQLGKNPEFCTAPGFNRPCAYTNQPNVLSPSVFLEMRDHILGRWQPLSNRPSRSVVRLISAIHEGLLDAELNVKVLKAKCGLSDHNVSSQFKLEMGITIRCYIEGLRMQIAGLVCISYRLTAVELSYRLGYEHVQTFYRAFRRYFGCTPKVYEDRNGMKSRVRLGILKREFARVDACRTHASRLLIR